MLWLVLLLLLLGAFRVDGLLRHGKDTLLAIGGILLILDEASVERLMRKKLWLYDFLCLEIIGSILLLLLRYKCIIRGIKDIP
jgi:hypothetical protein